MKSIAILSIMSVTFFCLSYLFAFAALHMFNETQLVFRENFYYYWDYWRALSCENSIAAILRLSAVSLNMTAASIALINIATVQTKISKSIKNRTFVILIALAFLYYLFPTVGLINLFNSKDIISSNIFSMIYAISNGLIVIISIIITIRFQINQRDNKIKDLEAEIAKLCRSFVGSEDAAAIE